MKLTYFAIDVRPIAIATFFALMVANPVAVQSASGSTTLTYIQNSTVKVEQMLGDCDWEAMGKTGTCLPTASQTVTRYNVLGSDVSSSFEDNGKVIFLFGDTISGNAGTVKFFAHDPIAWSTNTNPEAGLRLNYFTNADGSPLFVEPPGVAMGIDDVPNAGISLSDGIYLVCNTGADESLADPHQNASSILARFDETTKTFTTGRTISRLPGGHFIFTSVHASGTDVYMFGIGNYRASDIFLSKTPASAFWAGTGTQYFAGLVNGQPTWTSSEASAVPVVQDNPQNGPAWPNDAPSAGHVSVAYSIDLNLWLMTYDGGHQSSTTKGAYFTYAQQPWGPWAAPQQIFNEMRDNAFGVFIHNPNILPDPPGDGLNGPTIGSNDPNTTPGSAYAPLLIERFTTVTGDLLKIYYTMSTWNPYTVVRMRSEFKISPAPGVVTPTGSVVEFYDPDIKNYFITADPVEQAFVDTGAVGRWQRTGNAFEAGGPNQVCRFYGNANVNPATGTIYGPNSHFYTADVNECAGLKAIYTPTAKSWKFESNDFLTTPVAAGACPAGLAPVYRAYNNGFANGIDSNHRITTNYAAYQQMIAGGWIGEGVVMCAPNVQQWTAAWSVAHGQELAPPATPAMSGTSVRMQVRPTISGTTIRVRLENTLGQSNVEFSAAFIGAVQTGAALTPGSNKQITFGGQNGLVLAPGQGAYSDPIAFPVAAFQQYSVSLDVKTASDVSAHALGLVTNYIASGAHAADEAAAAYAPVPVNNVGAEGPTFPFYWVAALDVQVPSPTGTIVAFGDSITDGECSTRTSNGALSGSVLPDTYNRWTDLLANRLAAGPGNLLKAVANGGIAGNRVVSGGLPAVSRFDRDALGRSGVTDVIFFEGTNDIANGSMAAAVINADQQIIQSAHAAGLKIIGATIIPRGASNGWTATMEQQRLLLNAWIRQNGNFDGMIDFDALMQGPVNNSTGAVTIPTQWSCFDGIHPNSAGYAAMAGFINLSLFSRP